MQESLQYDRIFLYKNLKASESPFDTVGEQRKITQVSSRVKHQMDLQESQQFTLRETWKKYQELSRNQTKLQMLLQ